MSWNVQHGQGTDPARLDPDRGLVGGVLGRVVEQVAEHLEDGLGDGPDGQDLPGLQDQLAGRVGDPGRSLFMKALRPLYARGCRMSWLQLHDIDHTTKSARQAFLARVRSEMSRI